MGDIDLQTVYCRLCGIKCKKAVKIFSGKGRGMGLKEKILKCLLLSVKKSDQLPKRVCYTCIDRLDEFNQFNLLARQAQVKLRTLFKVHGIHVKEQKNSELISTWKALLASQEREYGKGSSEGRKRKRKSEIRLDVSSDSETSDSSSDSESPFQARHAILASSGPALNDNFSLPDSSVNYSNQRNASTSTAFISKLGGNKQERNLPSSTAKLSVSGPPKEEISSPIGCSQIIPVSRDIMMPYQQQSPSVDNSLTSAPPSQPLLIPSQIPNSVFLFNGNNIQSQNVGMSPLYVVNLAYNSSETVPNVSQVNNSCNITERTSPSTAEAPLRQSFSSFLPSNSSHSTNLPPEQKQNVLTSLTVPLTSESNLIGGVSSADVPPPLCPVDHLQRSQASGDVSKESQSHKPLTIPKNIQESVKDTNGLGQSCTNYAGISSSTVPCEVNLSTNSTFKNPHNINSNSETLSSLNSSIVSQHDKPPDCGPLSQFSDISDVEEVSKETVETPNDLPCESSLSLSTPQKDAKEVPCAGSNASFKVISQDTLSCDGDSPHSLTNVVIAPNKDKSHAGNSLVTKSSMVEGKECTVFESRGCTPHSSANLRISDNSKSVVASPFKEPLVSEKCKNVKDSESLKDFPLIMAENNKEDYLKIVSDTESDNISLEEVRRELFSKAKNSLQELNAIAGENEAEGLFTKSAYSPIDYAVRRKLFVSSEKSSSFSRKHAEAPITHVPSEINNKISLETDDMKDITILKEDLSKKTLRNQQPDTSISDQSPQKAMPKKMGKFKCELCSRHNPTFFSHITDAMYHHQQRHRGVCCLFSCCKCSFVTGQLQNLRQHILSSCLFDTSTLSQKSDEYPVPKIKQENSQDYEQALLNLKNALRSVSMPRFRKLLTSCKAVLSPEESEKKVDSKSSFGSSSPSCSTVNEETSHKSNCGVLDLMCYFCYSRFKSKAELQAHSKNCSSPEKGRESNLLDSPPAKKFKPMDVLSSSFTREGSYYCCNQCGKNFPSVFKAKMHATRSKSCRRTDQSKTTRDVESKLKSPDSNLPSTFRVEHLKKMRELQANQSAVSKESSILSDDSLNSGMVFDIPRIKVEKEDTEEEVLDVESVDGVNSVDVANSGDDKEKGGNEMKDLGTVCMKEKPKIVIEEKKSEEKESLHGSASQTKITQLEENVDFDLRKVKVEKSEDTPSDCVSSGNNLNEVSRENTMENSDVKQGRIDEKVSSPSRKSSTNSKVDFNLRVVRQYSTPFQILRPEDSKEPVVISKEPVVISKKLSPKLFPISANKVVFSVKRNIDPPAQSAKKLTKSVSKVSPAQEVKESTQVAHSASKGTKRTFRPILPKPTYIPFILNVNDDKNQPSQVHFGAPVPIGTPSTPTGIPSTSIETPSTSIGTPIPTGTPFSPIEKPTPIEKPSPIGKSSAPIGKPSTPIGKPSTPIENPSSPIGKPSAPIGKPSTPTAKTSVPIGKPILLKPPSETPKEESKSEKLPERTPTVSSPTSSKTTHEYLESSPSKVWLRNAEKYCMKKTQNNDPNRGLVLKVPLVKLTRLRLLNNGEVDINGIELGNEKHQQPSSSLATSGKNGEPSEANAKEGNKAPFCKEEPMEEDTDAEECILGS